MAKVAFECGLYMGRVLTCCDETIMAATAYTYNVIVINPGHMIKSDGVMAVFTYWSG